MIEGDICRRLLFEEAGIRGELVQLDASWQAVLQRHEYPPAVRAQLGQALAAVLLLSTTIKFSGALILQAHGQGPLQTLVAQATSERTIRGLARWQGEPVSGPLVEVFGTGHLVLTVQRQGAEPYQGIVPLEGDNLAAALQSYFRHSEQLNTRLWLSADGGQAAGLILQELPGEVGHPGDWERITLLADTLTEEELLRLPGEELLYRLFNEERVRLFETEPVSFRCGCSCKRIEQTLMSLGEDEFRDLLAERGQIEVSCEFCNREYVFDRVDMARIFAAGTAAMPASTRH